VDRERRSELAAEWQELAKTGKRTVILDALTNLIPDDATAGVQEIAGVATVVAATDKLMFLLSVVGEGQAQCQVVEGAFRHNWIVSLGDSATGQRLIHLHGRVVTVGFGFDRGPNDIEQVANRIANALGWDLPYAVDGDSQPAAE
jgi:hypothetical protein